MKPDTPSAPLPIGKLPPDLLARLIARAPVDDERLLDGPGIGITRDARTAQGTGRVTAMHDPTEGGVAAALWELANASSCVVRFDPALVPVTPLSARICAALAIDPLAALASGSLLLTAPPEDARLIREALEAAGIPCADIGGIAEGAPQVLQRRPGGWAPYPWPERDAMAGVFESTEPGQAPTPT